MTTTSSHDHPLTGCWLGDGPESQRAIADFAADLWSEGRLRELDASERAALSEHYHVADNRDPAEHGVAAAVAQVAGRTVAEALRQGDRTWGTRLSDWLTASEVPVGLLHQIAITGFSRRIDPRLDRTTDYEAASLAAHLVQAMTLSQAMSLFKSAAMEDLLDRFPQDSEQWVEYYKACEAFAIISAGDNVEKGLNIALGLLETSRSRTVADICKHAISVGPPGIAEHLLEVQGLPAAGESTGRIPMYRLARAYRYVGDLPNALRAINLALDANEPNRFGDENVALFAEQFQIERERIIQTMAQSTEAAALRQETSALRAMRDELQKTLPEIDERFESLDAEVRRSGARSVEMLAFFFTAIAIVLSSVSLVAIGDLTFVERRNLILLLTGSLIVFFVTVAVITRLNANLTIATRRPRRRSRDAK